MTFEFEFVQTAFYLYLVLFLSIANTAYPKHQRKLLFELSRPAPSTSHSPIMFILVIIAFNITSNIDYSECSLSICVMLDGC